MHVCKFVCLILSVSIYTTLLLNFQDSWVFVVTSHYTVIFFSTATAHLVVFLFFTYYTRYLDVTMKCIATIPPSLDGHHPSLVIVLCIVANRSSQSC